MTPDNIAPKPDYQQERVEAAARAIYSSKFFDKNKAESNWNEFYNKEDFFTLDENVREVIKYAKVALEAADAVTRPTQPEVMSAEDFADELTFIQDRDEQIEWIKQRDEALRKFEREKAKGLVEALRKVKDYYQVTHCHAVADQALTNYESGK